MPTIPPLKLKRKHVRITDIKGDKRVGEIVRRVTLPQSGTKGKKVFVLEEIKFPEWGTQLRLGYWIIGKKPRVRNKWTWGQFAPFIPKKDLFRLVEKAKRRGML